jgi:predicted ATPase
MTNFSSIEKNIEENYAIVYLTAEAKEYFNFYSDAYEITSECGCANIVWEDATHGEQHIQIAPGGTEDARILAYLVENPESALENIKSHIAALREDEAA